MKMGRNGDRLLSGGRIADEKNLLRLQGVPELYQFRDQCLVDFQPPGSVKNLDIATLCLSPIQRLPPRLDHILLARSRPIHGDTNLLSELSQLINGSRPLKVASDQQ